MRVSTERATGEVTVDQDGSLDLAADFQKGILSFSMPNAAAAPVRAA